MSGSSRDDEIAAYYARGLERDRLLDGPGALEFLGTQVLLERHLPRAPAVVAGVGGGPGRYAVWLAEHGDRVHLVDPIPLHVEQARVAASVRPGHALASAEVGDARALQLPDASVDAVLLLGPLYHLPERADRLQALREARRVCRTGGVIIAAAISRFASTLDGLRGGYLDDSAFAAVAAGDRRDGRHFNPTGHPAYFTTAYFHRPDELAAACTATGLSHEATVAVEGPGWLLPDLDARLADERRRVVLLTALDALRGRAHTARSKRAPARRNSAYVTPPSDNVPRTHGLQSIAAAPEGALTGRVTDILEKSVSHTGESNSTS